MRAKVRSSNAEFEMSIRPPSGDIRVAADTSLQFWRKVWARHHV